MKTFAAVLLTLALCFPAFAGEHVCTNILTGEVAPYPGPFPSVCTAAPGLEIVCDLDPPPFTYYVEPEDLDAAWEAWGVIMSAYTECWITNYSVYLYCVVYGCR